MLRYFGFSAFLTVAAIVAALIGLGPMAALTVTVLIAIEIAFSFDNAIINAKVLERLSHFWQHLFLTIGVVVAIIGMRLLFPILIVVLTAHLGWHEVIQEALHQPTLYATHLAGAHVAIAAFGGGFLLTLALYFLFDDEREVLWLKRLERHMQRVGGIFLLEPVLAAIVVGLAGWASVHSGEVWRAGLTGIAGYTLLTLLTTGLDKLTPQARKTYTGWSAFLAFMYLQVLDASFSFDGVLGAFAITTKVLLIVLGLGVGAVWVRSLTVFMVRRGTLKAYIYLEHGAHYAILMLATALMASIFFDIPDAVTGLTGLGIIGASFVASRQALRDRQNA